MDAPHKLRRIRKHYEARVNPDRENFDILDWGSRDAQVARFGVLLGALESLHKASGSRPTVLDVGCGMADLAHFLEVHSVDADYVGADITYAVIREAFRRSPGRDLVLADVFSAPPFRPRSFTAVFCSGVFNLKVGNNDAFVTRAIPALLGLAQGVVVVNMLHCRTRHQYPHCHYYDPDALLEKLTIGENSIEIIDDYLENDFTLVIRPKRP